MAIVQTQYGRIEGIERDGLHVFRGIPFAAPPVGAQRWMPPQAPESWTGVRPCDHFGSVAPQPPRDAAGPLATLGTDAAEESEDCLTLNVWTPGLEGRRPVLVWIHGGAFNRGTGSSPIYDGRALAKRGDVVVVTINYRLGPLGFLNLAQVTGGRIPATGNEGLLDQVTALRFVRENIEAFGGDPDCVTIFGESAGGMSVGALLGLPAAAGLFHRAIPQSGASSTAHPIDRGVRVAEHLLDALGVRGDDPGALIDLPAERLIEVGQQIAMTGNPSIGGMIFQPVIDGEVLPRLPLESVAQGSADGVPVLVGSTLHEWRLFLAMDPGARTLDEERLLGRIERNPSEQDLRPALDAYRRVRSERGDDVRPVALFEALQTDRIFRMPAVRLAETVAARGGDAYKYRFGWASPLLGGRLGACHAIEIGFVFGTHDRGPAGQFFGSGPSADALSDIVKDAWLAFARSGSPETEALTDWRPYAPDRRSAAHFDEKSGVEIEPAEAERTAWDAYTDGITVGRI